MVDLSAKAMDDFVTNSIPWNPQPLRRYERAEAYPVERFPPLIADAIREVADYVQAPVALVAGCALSAISTAVQSRYSVQRDPELRGPASLYILTVAESGERKSTIDKLFMKAIRKWEAEQAKAAEPVLAEYKATLEAWEIEGRRIRAEVRDGMNNGPFNPIVAHELNKPQPPRIPRMVRLDDTPEALALALAAYPIAAVISAEAGVIFGSHGMNADTVQRNLAQANAMWDGGPIDQDRISRERIRVEEVRVTMGLQVQPAVLENFIQRTSGLARGIGYLARFLFSRPESTQGSRFYAPPPADMPALNAFHARVKVLLTTPAEFDIHDQLDPQYLALSSDAHKVWFRFHDEVEEQMGGDDVFSGIRDVASKAAENAARLACCLHVAETGGKAPIPEMTMVDACALMRWYLDEAVRFSRAHDLTEEVRLAEMLEEWLVRQVRAKKNADITVNMARQKGPNALRVRQKMDAAVELLEDHGRIRIIKPTGTKKRYIMVAPQVIREWS